MSRNRLVLFILFSLLSLVSCTGSTEPNVPETIAAAGKGGPPPCKGWRKNDPGCQDPEPPPPENQPPTAVASVSCANLLCSFEALDSSDPDGQIESYEWDFGDDETGLGVTIDHIYSTEGSYIVTLTVVDDGGLSDQTTVTANPSEPAPTNEPPTASANVLCTDLTCTFDASESTDPDGTLVLWAWDFGDGTQGSGEMVQHTYTIEGSYTAILVVEDEGGLMDQTSVIANPTEPTEEPPPPAGSRLWIDYERLQVLPMSGTAWQNVKSEADSDCGTPDLSNQDDNTNVCIMAKALIFARTGTEHYRTDVTDALSSIVQSGTYDGRALALGRELAAYVISADLIALSEHNVDLDVAFRAKINELRTTYADGGGVTSLIECHERRPNNWGTHCGASRIAVAAYLGDQTDLDRAAQVFKGYLGDRSAYADFKYGSDLSWQTDPDWPVGVNPLGSSIQGHDVDGVLPDDQRRGGSFSWPPPCENYVWEGLQGAHAQAVLLDQQGYDVWAWEDQAILRAVDWLHVHADCPAVGDDEWQTWLTNYYYGTSFPAADDARHGKNVGWTDWTHR